MAQCWKLIRKRIMASKAKIAMIGTVGIPSQYGGFETLTEHLVRQLGNQYDFTIYCSKKHYAKTARKKNYLGARLKYFSWDANGLQGFFYDTFSILHALFYADILMIMGVSGAWVLPFVKFFTNKKIIVSIDGLEWRRVHSNRIVTGYLKWAEKIAVKYSHADISDNETIQDYTALKYGTLSNIIEYGANHTIATKPSAADKKAYPFLSKPYAFTVCRIEAANNIHLILEAFSKMPNYTIVIIGNWDNSEYGIGLREKYSSRPNLVLLDSIYNQQVLDTLRGNALLYVHGHGAGGTNPSLVEAMYLGLPIVAFDVMYNRTTTENKALYFKSVDELINIIESTRLGELKARGMQMKEIAGRRYTWELIAKKYRYLFNKIRKTNKKISVKSSLSEIPQLSLLNSDLAHLKTPTAFYEER